MSGWRDQLKFDPLPALLSSGDDALQYFVRRDLLGEPVGPVSALWRLAEAQRLLKKQSVDGSWPRPGGQLHPAINYPLIETWRQFRILVEQYGFNREHPQAEKAVEFLFACQTPSGDFRGMLANQYATYYSGALLALIIRAGYSDDARVEKGFQWLLAMRQDDGGWSVPLITHKFDRQTQYRLTSEQADPVEPDRSKPFSHNWTGMVLRAFAAHPDYRACDAARAAAVLLASRFFQPDVYTSYQAASYWVRFEYPFWWNHLVAALDAVTWIGLTQEDEQVGLALRWLRDHQRADGLWRATYAQPPEQVKDTPKNRAQQLWITLAISRIFRRLYG